MSNLSSITSNPSAEDSSGLGQALLPRRRYRVLQHLGEGGAAKVFLALMRGPQGFNKLVVLKVPHPDASDLTSLPRFLDEARLAARLNHPNIVETYEVFERRGVPIIVMQYLEGQPLSAVNRRCAEQLSAAVHLHILIHTLAGLHHSHELRSYDGKPLGVVHRDVSPQNVFVTYDGQVKVLDFGIAKLVGSEQTATGIVRGKLSYMAPEQLLAGDLDRRADVFSVGVMLWEALTGTRLYAGLNEPQIFNKLAHGDFRRPSVVRPVDPELERIVLKAMAPNVDDRYSTALDMMADLESFLTESSGALQRKLQAEVSRAFLPEREERSSMIQKHLASTNLDDSSDTLNLDEALGTVASGAPAAYGSGEVTRIQTTTSPFVSLARAARTRARPIVASLAVVAIGVWLTSWVTREGPAPAPSQLATALPAKQVTVSIQVQPSSALIFLDGMLLGSSPYRGTMTADDNPHELRVEAPDYETQRRVVGRSQNLDLKISLVARAVPAEPPRHQSPPAIAKRRPTGAKVPAGGAPLPNSASTNCSPPYYFDSAGIKQFKPACI